MLHGVSASIPQGKTTALVGRCGSGKTTLLSLLERLYTPQDGRVTMGGRNIADYDLRAYRNHFAYVQQDAGIFGGTFRSSMTYGLEPISGMALLIGLYIGGVSGGLVAAILLRIPGTPSSVATCFDGYPLAAKGQAGKALGVGIFFSFLGTIFGILVLMCVSPVLAKIALKFSFYEYFAVGVFSMTMMASLISGSVVKGLASGAIGLLFAMVGAAPIDGLPRLTFGVHALDGGFDILPVPR